MPLTPHHRRLIAALASVLVLLAVAWPVTRKPWEDSFPFSPYAMFATPRPTKLTIDYGIGETASGGRRPLKPSIVGSGEVLQALNVLAKARQAKKLPELCARMAERVAKRADFADVVSIRIVRGTHDAVEFLVRGTMGPEVVNARCEVKR